MRAKTAIVITSVHQPNGVIREIARECACRSLDFLVIGDVSSPAEFCVEGCSFYSIDRQISTGFRTAQIGPTRHYARKNTGYLLAMERGCTVIVETDDDNFPLPDFWLPRERARSCPVIEDGGWVNLYRYFTDANVWPRGLPLQAISLAIKPLEQLPVRDAVCPIQQGLAADNPDVDAIYRLVLPLPVTFANSRCIALTGAAWCPFNSQNTTWFAEAFPLLYLPSFCSFRMTDIWRSFVAQRIGRVNGWAVLFESPTVVQERNDHNLMKDFEDEVPGYLHNDSIAEALDALSLRNGEEHIAENLRTCYDTLVRRGWVEGREMPLLDAWLDDLGDLSP